MSQSSSEALSQARTAFAQRDFQRAIDLTTEVLSQDLMNDEARVLNEKARERMEAQPFIEQFSKKVANAIASGNMAGAKTDLEKMRQLDPDHPSIPRLEASISSGGSPSFVIDSPAQPPSGRSAAQATDFGFTFEEEKPKEPEPAAFGGFSFGGDSGGSGFAPTPPAPPPVESPASFSFDTPLSTPAVAPPPPPPPPPPAPAAPAAGGFSFDAPAAAASSPFGDSGFSFDAPASTPGPPTLEKAPSSGEFDFATASVSTSPEDQEKVQQYLAEGDRAFEAGDDQQAIDLWSRIFLIDVTNDEASARIEKAKMRKREGESDIDSQLAAAIAAFDRGDKADARDRLLEILRRDPDNTTANDYLEQINASATLPAPGGAPMDDLFNEPAPSASPAPAAAAAAAKPAAAPAAAKKAAPKAAAAPAKKGIPTVAIIAAAVVVLALGGWFAWSKFSKPATDPAATQAIFKQSQALAQKGQYDLAIAMLQDVKPEDPQHDKALSMIADLQHRKAQSAELVNGRPAAVVFQENLANGKAAFEAHDYDAAKRAFDAAARIKALPEDMKQLYNTASQQVAKLDSAKALFKEQRYADALVNLASLAEQDPQNASIKRIITDAHFNLGAQALTEERLGDAVKEFDEVLKMDPSDDLAKRSKQLAERYNGQPKDLLYKIYVKYLPTRRVG
jgi:hypothetical protein